MERLSGNIHSLLWESIPIGYQESQEIDKMRTVSFFGHVDRKAVGDGMMETVIPISMPYAKVRNLEFYSEIKEPLYKLKSELEVTSAAI